MNEPSNPAGRPEPPSQTRAAGYGEAADTPLGSSADLDRLRALLLEGIYSGPGVVADDAYFAALRDRVHRRAVPSDEGAYGAPGRPGPCGPSGAEPC